MYIEDNKILDFNLCHFFIHLKKKYFIVSLLISKENPQRRTECKNMLKMMMQKAKRKIGK